MNVPAAFEHVQRRNGGKCQSNGIFFLFTSLMGITGWGLVSRLFTFTLQDVGCGHYESRLSMASIRPSGNIGAEKGNRIQQWLGTEVVLSFRKKAVDYNWSLVLWSMNCSSSCKQKRYSYTKDHPRHRQSYPTKRDLALLEPEIQAYAQYYRCASSLHNVGIQGAPHDEGRTVHEWREYRPRSHLSLRLLVRKSSAALSDRRRGRYSGLRAP